MPALKEVIEKQMLLILLYVAQAFFDFAIVDAQKLICPQLSCRHNRASPESVSYQGNDRRDRLRGHSAAGRS